MITKEQGKELLHYSRAVLKRRFNQNYQVPQLDDQAFATLSGTFVTLKIRGELRGCIGNIEPVRTILEGVEANSISAAFHDSRFAPLTRDELERAHISISVLTPAKPLEYSDAKDLLAQLRRGVDGVILRHGRASATFLPQVWEQLQSPEAFLSHLCNKAGLPQDIWQREKVEIEIYQAQNFAEEKE